jgi:hypothetical protein
MGEPTSRDGSVLGVSSDVLTGNKAMSTTMQVLLLARFVAPLPAQVSNFDHHLFVFW